jgi:4'-phosphopantetheinyl transferase
MPAALRPDQVHAWFVDLARGPVADGGRCLDPAERGRAERFRHEWHRRRYRASHCAFRHLVAGYLGCAAAEVRIARHCAHCGDPEHGKPTVAGPAGGRRLEVNASHAGEVGLVAVAWAPLVVGVDVERLRPGVDWPGVLRQLDTEPAPTSELDAFQRWTRIEAVTKAAGLGLAARPSMLLSGQPSGHPSGADGWRPARVPGSTPTWQVCTLPAPDGYAAALAADRIPAAGVTVSCWQDQGR